MSKYQHLIISSDKLTFDSNISDLEIYCGKNILISTNENILFDIGSKDNKNSNFTIRASRINLGKRADEPILKGNKTIDLLEDIINKLTSFSNKLSDSKGYGSGVISLPKINMAATLLSKQLSKSKSKLKDLKSSISFVE